MVTHPLLMELRFTAALYWYITQQKSIQSRNEIIVSCLFPGSSLAPIPVKNWNQRRPGNKASVLSKLKKILRQGGGGGGCHSHRLYSHSCDRTQSTVNGQTARISGVKGQSGVKRQSMFRSQCGTDQITVL